jgi:hypothetical protein
MKQTPADISPRGLVFWASLAFGPNIEMWWCVLRPMNFEHPPVGGLLIFGILLALAGLLASGG